MRRKPRTAAQLMPLRRAVIDQFSLQQHCALAAFRNGSGTPDQIAILARVVYLPFLMGRAEHGRVAPTPYRTAEAMLHRCILRGQAGQGWRLETDEAAHFEGLLVHYDAQLMACRAHVYDEAISAMTQAELEKRSPLADRKAPPEDSAFFMLILEIAVRAMSRNSCDGSAAFVGDDARFA